VLKIKNLIDLFGSYSKKTLFLWISNNRMVF